MPSPEGHGWKVDEDGLKWTDGKIVSQELIDILCNNSTVCDYDDDNATEADTMMDVVYKEYSDGD